MPDMARRKRKSKERLEQLINEWFQREHDLLPFDSFLIGDTAHHMAEAAYTVLEATVAILEHGTKEGVLHWEGDCPTPAPTDAVD